MRATPGCVVFDVDDTLYLERDYVRSGLRAVDEVVRSRCGAAGLLSVAWADFLAGRRGDLFDRALEALGVPPTPELVALLVDRYRTHVPDIGLLPDARRALASAAVRGPVAVVTDGPAASQQAKVRALALETWAAPVVLTSVRFPGRPKPDPAAFVCVQTALQVQPSACVYVADNPLKDFAGPAELGWRTVRVRRRGSLHEALESDDDVDLEVTSLEDLDRVLPRLRRNGSQRGSTGIGGRREGLLVAPAPSKDGADR